MEIATPALELPRKIWTREEAHALLDTGFPRTDKLELINGDLIGKMKKRPHVICQHRIQKWLERAFGGQYIEIVAPIDVTGNDNVNNEPEPDLILTAEELQSYQTNPQPRDIRLLIEVADSSLALDLNQKAALYARAAIVEYWVIDLPHQLVPVHRNPLAGAYRSIVSYSFAQDIAPLAKPDSLFCMDRL